MSSKPSLNIVNNAVNLSPGCQYHLEYLVWIIGTPEWSPAPRSGWWFQDVSIRPLVIRGMAGKSRIDYEWSELKLARPGRPGTNLITWLFSMAWMRIIASRSTKWSWMWKARKSGKFKPSRGGRVKRLRDTVVWFMILIDTVWECWHMLTEKWDSKFHCLSYCVHCHLGCSFLK